MTGENNAKGKDIEIVKSGAVKITEKDIGKVVENADEIGKKFNRGILRRFIENAKLLLSMVKDYWSKRYREIPWWAISAIVFALLYVFSPIDAIPDFIPFVGLLDDAGVISACLALVEKQLEEYKKWKNTKGVA